MAEDDRERGEEVETRARHSKLVEVGQGKRAQAWSDLETLIYDSRCLTPQGKQVAIWSIATMKALLKEKFLEPVLERRIMVERQTLCCLSMRCPSVLTGVELPRSCRASLARSHQT